jgi:Ca2+/Na+ antiporter
VSAAGTSLPNYVASKVAAQNGFGNMAVSNAFGSNTFNIMIGLGLPWCLYTSFGTGFQPYHDLRNEGIIESVSIMGFVCFLFILFMIPSDFVLYKWHGYVFVACYVAYLVCKYNTLCLLKSAMIVYFIVSYCYFNVPLSSCYRTSLLEVDKVISY